MLEENCFPVTLLLSILDFISTLIGQIVPIFTDGFVDTMFNMILMVVKH